MDLGLRDKTALITGSSRGLGFASARALAKEGSRVCLCARGEDQLLKAGAELASVAGAADRVTLVRADLSTPKGAEDAVAHAVAVFGRARGTNTDWNELKPPAAPPWREVPAFPMDAPFAPRFASNFEFRISGAFPFVSGSEAHATGWIRATRTVRSASNCRSTG